jgi:lipid-A-disaccharide synthase
MHLKKIAIVAGEKSGDYLGSKIVSALKKRHPNAEFVGLAGPLMQAQGVRSLAEMEKISIMGFDGLLSSIFEILSIRKKLRDFFLDWQPDVFIGIDVPDFNLGLELKLKQSGTPVAHCVSPTVWAWRGGRITKIKRAIHKMLALFPFEEDYYKRHDTPVVCIGHPLANQVRNWVLPNEFIEAFPKKKERRIAILPGSRMSEVGRLAATMFAGARALASKFEHIEFVIPAANSKLADYMRDLEEFDPSIMRIADGYSRDVLASSDIAILASGTAALEAALFAKPMVVMYQVSKLTAWHAGRTMQVSHYSMPNHLTSPPAVKEFVQEEANVENLVGEVSRLLEDHDYYQTMQAVLAAIAPELDKDFGLLSAKAIEDLVAQLSPAK